jgi:hypothetical protein
MVTNWQLSGSVVLSKTTGNSHLGDESGLGFAVAPLNPNSFVNFLETSRLDYDRPLTIKLLGTYRFPYNFFISLYYMHLSGTPWARSVTILPPLSWTEEANAYRSYAKVLLEAPGTRRDKAVDNLDIRLSKKFATRRLGQIDLYVDVFNALGNQYSFIDQNDGGYWFPTNENSPLGTRILNPSYRRTTSLLGTRTLKIGIQFNF